MVSYPGGELSGGSYQVENCPVGVVLVRNCPGSRPGLGIDRMGVIRLGNCPGVGSFSKGLLDPIRKTDIFQSNVTSLFEFNNFIARHHDLSFQLAMSLFLF